MQPLSLRAAQDMICLLHQPGCQNQFCLNRTKGMYFCVCTTTKLTMKNHIIVTDTGIQRNGMPMKLKNCNSSEKISSIDLAERNMVLRNCLNGHHCRMFFLSFVHWKRLHISFTICVSSVHYHFSPPRSNTI
jgi:hypothetical protein